MSWKRKEFHELYKNSEISAFLKENVEKKELLCYDRLN